MWLKVWSRPDAKQVIVFGSWGTQVFVSRTPFALTVTALPLASLEPSSMPSTRADLDRIHTEVRNITLTCKKRSGVAKVRTGSGRRSMVRDVCNLICNVRCCGGAP